MSGPRVIDRTSAARRTGLPRPTAADAFNTPTAESSPQSAAAASGGAPNVPSRRTGLPGPGPNASSATDAAQSPAQPSDTARAATAPPTPSRRAGLPRPADAAPATPAAAPLAPVATPAPAVPAAAPERKRYGRFTVAQWAGAVIIGFLCIVAAVAIMVFAVRWFMSLNFMQDFLTTYPGNYDLPHNAPVGFPAWLEWQHFLNAFFIVLIIRSGWQVRTEKRPTMFWSPRWNTTRKISLNLWFHQSLDILWLVNGVIFIVLLFTSGQWLRMVPTSWSVIPNGISAALQYASLSWPTEDGWVNYNSLQQLSYFAIVFLAAPLAALTGARMSGFWPKNAKRLSRIYPVEWARAVHFPVMIVFVVFVVVHVTLVLATGALRNLNHMYGSQDAVNWTGFWIFVASLAVMAAAWVTARPLVLVPIARLFGNVGR